MKKLTLWLESLATSHTPDFEECVSLLGNYFPLLHDLAETEQDKQWHAEGNVAVHTDMVLSQLYDLLRSEASHITGAKRQALILSALLHDIAKPLTTRRKEVNGIERIVASGHEEAGAGYLALKLIELPLEHKVIMTIMGLVGFHQVPKLLVVKNRAYHDYFHLALNADLELLYWLELADMKGRLCDDLEKQLDLLEQFRLFAQEYQLWSVADPMSAVLNSIQVKSSHDEQQYLNGYAVHQLAHDQISMAEEAIAKNDQNAQRYSHLYIMCGISGSGKSSWIARNLNDVEIISLDEIRKEINGKRSCQKNITQVLQTARARLKVALANKRNVVWDATNIRTEFRQSICDYGLRYGALITIVAFQIKESSLRTNNRNRQHVVADKVISDQISQLQWPSVTEGHRMVVIGEKGLLLSEYGFLDNSTQDFFILKS